MNNIIKNKRSSLERFIYEQIIGPGISGYRFVDKRTLATVKDNLTSLHPLENINELINIAPASVYSSGILFPIDSTPKDAGECFLNNSSDETIYEETHEIETSEKLLDDVSVDESDSIETNQMYPTSMGMSCCFDSEILSKSDIIIDVRARHYIKLDTNNEEFVKNYGINCEFDINVFKELIIDTILNDFLIIENISNNNVLLLRRLLTTVDKSNIKNAIYPLKQSLSQELIDKFNFIPSGYVRTDFSAIKQACFYQLKNNSLDINDRQKIYEISQKAEEYESIFLHIDDLLNIYDTRSYGIWQCVNHEVKINLPDNLPNPLHGKKIYTFNKYISLKDIILVQLDKNETASLSLNLQFSKDSRNINNKVFLKVQVVNTSTAFVATGSKYFSTANENVNKKCFFGLKIRIQDKRLLPYNNFITNDDDNITNEDVVTKFIYRQFEDYAIGHGCSVKWDKENSNVETEYIPFCDTPDSDTIPKDKNNLVTFEDSIGPSLFPINPNVLQFKWLSLLSGTKDDEVINGLKEFVDCYEKWISSKKEEYSKKDNNTKAIAFSELEKCSLDKDRMLCNINLLLCGNNNKENLLSFRLMNSSMFMQLWHSVNVKINNVISEYENPNFNGFNLEFYQNASDRLYSKDLSASWRAFQLAFIILNLDGIFKKEDDDRWEQRNEWVDLIWFPTGGGKTEAYLGLIALTIINRRRKYMTEGGGTAAIIRYTLRLLTLQQFQRASLLIMALELLRRWGTYGLGKEPIFIGMWVGNNSLPNRLEGNNGDNLLSEFNKLARGEKSKLPFTSCPWCGSKLNPSAAVEIDSNKHFYFKRLLLKCSNTKCSFFWGRPSRARADQGPIPVSLCDEEIYMHPPALLFGTVDKFAQLAHKTSNLNNKRNKDSRRIFGRGNWEDGKPPNGYLPPDLIIQDELHLLLGPLGSSVALFETAVDTLCRRTDGLRPKIISSTATTRNTSLQIMALFDRKVNLFPKPGPDCDDAFFSFYKRVFKDIDGNGQEYLSKRRYLGILPTGRTQIWMQMRLIAILITHRAIFELSQLNDNTPIDYEGYKAFNKAMDYYHSIISYFNSLREVGKTESQIHTYIEKEVRRVFNRVIRPQKLMHSFNTYILRDCELTGRLSGEDVKKELDKVQLQWEPQNRFAKNIANVELKKDNPPDIIIATNMISVGIDVARFNTMIINSMPRNIAEYIQASSRVARDSYGLVLTVHHPFRSRDISHYEKFIEFHEKMYSYVEPISITPFTDKAVDRYLGLFLATILRHTTEYVERESATKIRSKNKIEILETLNRIFSVFENRKKNMNNYNVEIFIKNLLNDGNLKNIRKWIEESLNDWLVEANKVVAEGRNFVFSNAKNNANPPQRQLYVATDEYSENVHSSKWQIPMSLRVVEPETALKINLK